MFKNLDTSLLICSDSDWPSPRERRVAVSLSSPHSKPTYACFHVPLSPPQRSPLLVSCLSRKSGPAAADLYPASSLWRRDDSSQATQQIKHVSRSWAHVGIVSLIDIRLFPCYAPPSVALTIAVSVLISGCAARVDVEPPPCRGEAEGVAGGGRCAGRRGGEVCPRHGAGVVDVQVAEEACQGRGNWEFFEVLCVADRVCRANFVAARRARHICQCRLRSLISKRYLLQGNGGRWAGGWVV